MIYDSSFWVLGTKTVTTLMYLLWHFLRERMSAWKWKDAYQDFGSRWTEPSWHHHHRHRTLYFLEVSHKKHFREKENQCFCSKAVHFFSCSHATISTSTFFGMSGTLIIIITIINITITIITCAPSLTSIEVGTETIDIPERKLSISFQHTAYVDMERGELPTVKILLLSHADTLSLFLTHIMSP